MTWPDTFYVTYDYDQTGAEETGEEAGKKRGHTPIFFAYLLRIIGSGAPINNGRTISYQYNAAGQRTRMTWPDGFYVTYDYDQTGAVTHIRENGATSGAGVLATYAYDNLGRMASLTRGNGVVTTTGFDAASRLTQLVHNPAGTTHDQTVSFTYNAAGQIG